MKKILLTMIAVMLSCGAVLAQQVKENKGDTAKVVAQSCGSCDCSARSVEICETVDQEAEFPGGKDALYDYLRANTPQSGGGDLIMNADVKFVVLSDGTIGDVEVTNETTSIIKEHATNLVKNFPRFSPAIKDGNPVASWSKVMILYR